MKYLIKILILLIIPYQSHAQKSTSQIEEFLRESSNDWSIETKDSNHLSHKAVVRLHKTIGQELSKIVIASEDNEEPQIQLDLQTFIDKLNAYDLRGKLHISSFSAESPFLNTRLTILKLRLKNNLLFRWLMPCVTEEKEDTEESIPSVYRCLTYTDKKQRRNTMILHSKDDNIVITHYTSAFTESSLDDIIVDYLRLNIIPIPKRERRRAVTQ